MIHSAHHAGSWLLFYALKASPQQPDGPFQGGFAVAPGPSLIAVIKLLGKKRQFRLLTGQGGLEQGKHGIRQCLQPGGGKMPLPMAQKRCPVRNAGAPGSIPQAYKGGIVFP